MILNFHRKNPTAACPPEVRAVLDAEEQAQAPGAIKEEPGVPGGGIDSQAVHAKVDWIPGP